MNEIKDLEQAFFILEHGSAEGLPKYLKAIEMIKEQCVQVVRCEDCKRWDDVPADETQDHECHLFDGNKENLRIATPSYWFCPKGERRSE